MSIRYQHLAISVIAVCLIFTAHAGACDLASLEELSSRKDSLTAALVNEVYEHVDTACTRNARYAELLNPLLFMVFQEHTATAVDTFATLDHFTRHLILRELENPIDPTTETEKILTKVENLPGRSRSSKRIAHALKRSAQH